jgi:hypothetical protein
MTKQMPVFAERGAQLPKNTLFHHLREIWMEETGERSKALADMLGVRQQNVSQWATGSDGREPPDWVLMRLCHECKRELIWCPDSVRIEKSK